MLYKSKNKKQMLYKSKNKKPKIKIKNQKPAG